MDKKGSMELGINAIVIIIIALAILGLGIGFVTKLFTSSGEKLGSIIDRTELPVHSDSQNPIVFETSYIKVKKGGSTNLKVAVYNDGIQDTVPVALNYDGSSYTTVCTDENGDDAPYISIVSPTQIIPAGNEAGFGAIVKDIGSSTEKQTYICTVQITLDDGVSETPPVLSKQIFVQVI